MQLLGIAFILYLLKLSAGNEHAHVKCCCQFADLKNSLGSKRFYRNQLLQGVISENAQIV